MNYECPDEKTKEQCFRCQCLINIDNSYQLVDGNGVCPHCAIIGEELMPDEEGDLQVTQEGKEWCCKIFDAQLN